VIRSKHFTFTVVKTHFVQTRTNYVQPRQSTNYCHHSWLSVRKCVSVRMFRTFESESSLFLGSVPVPHPDASSTVGAPVKYVVFSTSERFTCSAVYNFVSFRSPYLFYPLTVGVEVVYFHLITLRHTPQSVELLWTRDRPVAETST
jgi:hypothetical protein